MPRDPVCPSCGEAWRYYFLRVSGMAAIDFDQWPCQDVWHTPFGAPSSVGRSPHV